MARTPPSTQTALLYDAAALFIRRPSEFYDDDGVGVLVFNPTLSGAEQTLLDRLRKLIKSAVQITPTEYEAIEADIAGLTTYQNLPTPTLAQTVLAVKAQSRILRALLRDS